MESRLEFRVFDRDLLALHVRMRRAFAPLGQDRHDDIYLIGGDTGRSWKLRDGAQLDLKCLIGLNGAFQRWAPSGAARLPAAAGALAAGFGPGAALPDTGGGTGAVDAARLLAAFTARGFSAHRLRKRRWRYDAVTCRAEFVTLLDGARTLHSVAIEGPDRGELEDLRLRLGLQGRANLSYPGFLRPCAALPPAPPCRAPGDGAPAALAPG